jgi:formylmethanofuran dehydrogenase subunit E
LKDVIIMCEDFSSGYVENQDPPIVPFSDVVKFHGHFCGGITLGYIAATIAIRELRTGRDVDELMVAIVENDACGLDAIQMVTGCTIGKGNLILRDYGKHVYTFINRVTHDAVRISSKGWPSDGNPLLKTLREKAWAGTATPDELQTMQNLMQEDIRKMLADPPEKYFDVKHVTTEIPGKARIFATVKCAKCGEMVAESRARVQDGGIVCIPCYDEYTRGW